MSAATRSPDANRTPQARPPDTSISATSLLQRSMPPWSRIRRAMPSTSRPVPPTAKCTPYSRSRKAIMA
jgi:hypothetical protein